MPEREPTDELKATSRVSRKAMLLAGVVVFVAGVGGYFLGTSTGEDLTRAREIGAAVGQQQGGSEGARNGYRLGFKRGRDVGFRATYPRSFKESYAEAFVNAGLEAPSRSEIEVPRR